MKLFEKRLSLATDVFEKLVNENQMGGLIFDQKEQIF